MAIQTSIILRLEIDKSRVAFSEVVTNIADVGGDLVAIDVIRPGAVLTTRDVTVTISEANYEALIEKVSAIEGVKLVHASDSTFLVHLGGKLTVQPKTPIKNREDLSRVYTPGVARVCMAIAEEPRKAFTLTMKRNTVAVVSDGTAVLGLGSIGPEAAMPVMEGKAMLFKQLADVDAYPICLNTTDTEEIISIIKGISPGFGGINLEDISSPRCFEIEERLKQELNIPVFHDDQHGTAVVILSGLTNALKLVGKSIADAKIVIVGIGAAGSACSNMLLSAGASRLYCVDREGVLNRTRTYDNPMWQSLAERTNPEEAEGGLGNVIKGADVFIGLSRSGLLTVEDVQKMAQDPIVFAMANPEPEIDPDAAEHYVRVMATGRSDYPNQINNVLCFPGMFRGALDCRASVINEEMKLAAAQAIASVVLPEELSEQYIIPSIFNERVVTSVRDAVVKAAIETKAARRIPPEFR